MKKVLAALAVSAAAILHGGQWPDTPTPSWSSAPVATRYMHPGPIVIAGGETPVAETVKFNLPAAGAGLARVLVCDSFMLRAGEPGKAYALAFRLNGHDLRPLTGSGEFRLMNRGEYFAGGWKYDYKGRKPYFHEENYPSLLVAVAPEAAKARLGEAGTRYVLDLADYAKTGENILEVIHALPRFGDNTLRVENLAVGELDPARVKRAAAPKVLSPDEKTAYLLDQFDPANPAVKQIRTAGDARAQAAALLAYFRNRKPRPETVRINEIRRGGSPWRAEPQIAEDALTNKIRPFAVFEPVQYGDRIDFLTNPTPKREPNWLAQFNRLNYMSALAAVYAKTHDEKYAEAFFRQFGDWCRVAEANYAPGALPIWQQLSVGVRAKAIPEFLDAFIDSPACTPEALVTALYLLHRHADYLANIERTPKNWGLMEAEGLVFTAVFVPEFKQSGEWAKNGLAHLKTEFDHQVYPDGMHLELDWGYHYGCISWFGASSDLVKLNHRNDLAAAMIPDARFEKMYEIVAACAHPDGRTAAFGDASHIAVLNQTKQGFSRFPGNNLLRFIATSRREGTPPPLFRHFPDSGYYTMRSSWEPDAIHLVAKCGPDGGWHCNPDNGTFELYAFGRILTPDTGNYTYNWADNRAWYIASARHQTLTLDDRDTVYAPKHLRSEATPEATVIAFENRSYPDLKHRRTIHFLEGKYFVIVDEAEGPATGEVAIHFQTAAGSPLTIDKAKLNARTMFPEGGNLVIAGLAQPGLKMSEEPGEEAHYGKKEPRPAFRYAVAKKDAETIRFVTALVPFKGTGAPQVSLVRIDENNCMLNVNGTEKRIEFPK